MKDNYIYSPSCDDQTNDLHTNVFKCKVPLNGTKQVFVINGKVDKEVDEILVSGKDGGYNMSLERGQI